MPKSKNKRKPHSNSQRRAVRKPAILNRLEVSDMSLNKVTEMNKLSVMRFQLGTATSQDTCTLFTLLSVSQLLTQQFEEGPQLRRMFADAVVHLADFNKTGDLPADDRESVVNTFEVAMELWGKCSVEEVVRASKEIRDGKHSINDLFLSVLQSEEATTREETETAQPNAAS